MNIKTIKADIKLAMLSQDKEEVTFLRGLLSELQKEEKKIKKELSEAGALSVLLREKKKLLDSLGYAKQANRSDLISKHETELFWMSRYLPQPMTSEELTSEIAMFLLANENVDKIGPIMGHLNKHFKGRFDGKQASQIVNDVLKKVSGG